MTVEPALLKGLQWRAIGPYRGGRVVAVTGGPVAPMTFYFGACTGGVWKTTDGGTYWQNVSDGFFNTAAVGAIQVADADPNVVWAGTGESCIRGNVSHGDGVYRSTDGGKSWTNMGLRDTRHIARIRIHPSNPDVVYVAALGHAFGPNAERGVFRTWDGGRSWEKVLFKSENAGAIDLTLDPNNPRTLYAAIWQARRLPWELQSGGPESGIYKSTNGGDSWVEITDSPGLPKGLKGRIGLALSPARPSRIWAVIEAQDGGLFRSDDDGATWERVSDDRNLVQRAWYYMHVFADPKDSETCYILNLNMWRSSDGGRSFTQIATPHGDNHDLWIDANNPLRMIEGNDGGACVSFNGGASWSSIYNQPTAQFYHLDTDNQTPYRVYGTQQDNSAITAPSRSNRGAITMADCYPVGTSESGYIQVRPDNPNVVYSGAIGSSPGGGGNLLRYDHATGQTRIITVWPEIRSGWGANAHKYRFQWTYPIVISPHDANTLYCTGNRVFRSSDEGSSWEVISPDLTRNDDSKLGPSGGPVTKDTTGAEHYCTIFAFAESPHERGVFWAGSDDGLVHLSRDNGASWDDVTPPDLPEWGTVTMLEPSPHEPAGAYLAVHRYRLDDTRPYLWKTSDWGKSWQRIDAELPQDDFVRCVREDPARRGLLYAGTETNIYVSFDDGASWQSLRLNLPVVPVHDLQLKENDLVAATHGRSFWILDDVTPLHQISDQVAAADAHLFTVRRAIRYAPGVRGGGPPAPGKNYSVGLGAAVAFYEVKKPDGTSERVYLDGGANPPDGVVVYYVLREKPGENEEVTLTFYDRQGQEIRRFSSRQAQPPADTPGAGGVAGAEGRETSATVAPPSAQEPRVPADQGLNRFVWNMRYADARAVPGDVTTERSLSGPLAPPAVYSVTLRVNGKELREQFEIAKDPRVAASLEDLDAQFELALQIRDRLSETHDAINALRSVRRQLDEWEQRSRSHPNGAQVTAAATPLREQLAAIEEELIQPRAKVGSDTLNFPSRLNARLASITAVVAAADFAPPQQAYEVFQKVSAEIQEQLDRLRRLLDTDLVAFNDTVRQAGIPPVVPAPS
jgi:photosystem II stability/assembly factor-like uncharacterized protein